MSTRRPTVSTIMNRNLVTTRTDAKLAAVVEMMMRRGMGEIAVVGADRSFQGLVTRQALLEPRPSSDSAEEFLASAQRKGSVICELDEGFHLDVEADARVADVMDRAVISVKPETSAREAASLMAAHHVAVLPVVSGLGILMGTVSAVDLVGLF
ncbi:MAG: CBS domain-containing protein [Archangiaceae bacterium]|nr:CBS domain-containing protein [Archangiaceae bacterium]